MPSQGHAPSVMRMLTIIYYQRLRLAPPDALSRDGAEMRRTLKASKLRECENISLFRHFIILYGRYSSLITS